MLGKDSTPHPLSRNRMYLLCCRECRASYIRETGSTFYSRISEHVDAFDNGHPEKSAFARICWTADTLVVKKLCSILKDKYTRNLGLENIGITKKD